MHNAVIGLINSVQVSTFLTQQPQYWNTLKFRNTKEWRQILVRQSIDVGAVVDLDLADFHVPYLRRNMESSKSFFIDGLNVGLLIKKPLHYVVLFTFYSMEKHRLPFAIPGFKAATFFVQLFEQRQIPVLALK